jgi:hypothetical protein
VEQATGSFVKAFDVPKANNADLVLTACSLNPMDEKMYCATSTQYLVRFDKDNVGYVAKLPASTSAMTFTPGYASELFYEGSGYSGLYKTSATELADATAYTAGDNNNNLVDLSDDDTVAANIEGAQDLVITQSALEEDGQTRTYLVAMNVLWEVYVVRVSDGGIQTWKLSTTGDKSGTPTMFSSGFSLENRVFFSEDTGMGTYEVADIDLKTKTASISRLGPSAMTSKSDGVQCPDSKVPEQWKKQTPPTNTPTLPPSKCLPGFVQKNPCGCQTTVRCAKA